ncbi:hypothetical protein K0504_01350 [Neiella marina]|uniref:Uncharacterized protein n=1 Tax=Neiella holothuriorum TaxID=2870530 RepID=A0ABS7ED72_9GAMM|nr:hypothetical protein [Neiella holothuriorum]MBW8189667.1 hypothetical protein [Neiella holothuriorum]
MSINAALLGQFILVLAIVMAVACYYLGKRKTNTPILVSVIGFISATVPPLALIFLMLLVLKNDIPSKQNT